MLLQGNMQEESDEILKGEQQEVAVLLSNVSSKTDSYLLARK